MDRSGNSVVQKSTVRPSAVATAASCVCVELSARNSYGGHVGLKRVTIQFSDSDNVSVRNEGSGGAKYCPGLARFAELNGR